MRQTSLRKFAIATLTIASAAVVTVGWSVEPAQARRLYVTPYYHPFNPYIADQSGLGWYAVRAYYNGGPWCGVAGGSYSPTVGVFGRASWTCYSGWDDYKQLNGIGCDPGTLIKGGDGIMYVCQ
jgi:hypothetical protein